jgi:hypothetical protein
MSFVSVTRLRIRKWRYLLGFLYFTLLAVLQARRAAGNAHTKVVRDARRVFWSVTVWQDEHAMRQFRNHGAHLRAMPRLRHWCDEATYAHWTQDGAEPPELDAAYERLIREGIVSKVDHPTPDHALRNFPRPRN